MSNHLRYTFPTAALAILASCTAGSPESTALKYATQLAAGDLIPAYSLLSSRDTSSVSREEFLKNGREGVAGMIVDSARRKVGEIGDTATVYVFSRAPNVQQLGVALMQQVFSGQIQIGDTATAEREMKRQLHAAPLVTRIDSISLVREKEWRVWAGLGDRRLLDSLEKKLRDTYLERPLADRRRLAAEFLSVADRAARFVKNSEREYAQGVMLQAQCADSVQIELLVRASYFGRDLRGTIRNGCTRDIREIWIEAEDVNGDTRRFHEYGIPAGSRETVYEMTTGLSVGEPTRVSVLAIEFSGDAD